MPIRAMVDPGSVTMIISFEQFSRIGKDVQIPVAALKMPDLVLRDYSQQPSPSGGKIKQLYTVSDSVYVRSDQINGEPCLLGTNVVMPLGLMMPDPISRFNTDLVRKMHQ